MMAREGKKGRVPLMETAFNARSLKNKLVALKHAFNKNIVDMCIVNTLNCPFPPAIRWYSKWAKSVTKVPDSEAEMDMEMIHLRIANSPYLGSLPGQQPHRGPRNPYPSQAGGQSRADQGLG